MSAMMGAAPGEGLQFESDHEKQVAAAAIGEVIEHVGVVIGMKGDAKSKIQILERYVEQMREKVGGFMNQTTGGGGHAPVDRARPGGMV